MCGWRSGGGVAGDDRRAGVEGREIDPRPGREWEELTAIGKTPKLELWTASPPVLYRPGVAGWGPYPKAVSPESAALIGPRPLRGPAVMAGSGSTPLPAR